MALSMKRLLIIAGMMLAFGVLLTACSTQTATPTACPACPAIPTLAPTVKPTAVPPTPTPVPTVAPTPGVSVPFEALWKASGHANKDSEAFKHWDTADPKEIPASCAKCHSSTGFVTFAATGKNDKNVPTGTIIECQTCHNTAAEALASVTFPSGKVVNTTEEGEGLCMQCHQGRESKVSVDKQIANFKVTDVDAVVAPIKDDKGNNVNFGFLNVHYFAAGGTLYGSEAQMGYEYDGQTYDPKFRHVDSVDTCVACHDQHATTVRIDKCAECHTGAKTVEDLQKIRMNGSLKDYNGNGDTKEGIAAELKGLQDILMASIVAYANEVSKTPIVYDTATYPYYMVAGADGKPVKNDKGANIAYNAWTARLLKAAYNYQVSAKDPGAFAHNAKYTIELLYDSINDLNGKLTKKVDMTKLARDDAGHFDGASMAFRDWDDAGVVPYACSKCHSAQGLPDFIKAGGTQIVSSSGSSYNIGIGIHPTANGFMCSTCHDEANWPGLYAVTSVPFPSGKTATFSTEKDDKGNLKPVPANLCLECHQGRESTVSMNAAIAASGAKSDDAVAMKADGKTPAISFKNIHYFAAGATIFGTQVQSAYEFKDQKYNGVHPHVAAAKLNCSSCHDVHALGVKTQVCTGCHANAKDGLDKISMTAVDYDGNGKTEGMEVELKGMASALYAAMQKYALDKTKDGFIYDTASYPYFFVAGADGKVAKDDKGAAIRFSKWTPNLVRAAYNLQFFNKDPGAFTHNGKYMAQLLYDSIKAVGGDVSKMTRPPVAAPAK